MVGLMYGFGRVNYVTPACAPVTPGFPPPLISVIKAYEENPIIFGF